MESTLASLVFKLSRALKPSQACVPGITVSQANVDVTLRHVKARMSNPHVTVGNLCPIAKLETKEPPQSQFSMGQVVPGSHSRKGPRGPPRKLPASRRPFHNASCSGSSCHHSFF